MMKRLVIIKTLILLFYGLCVTTTFGFQQSSLEGDWQGQVKFDGKEMRLDAHFKNENGNIKGTVEYPLREQIKFDAQQTGQLELTQIRVDSSQVHFQWQEESKIFVFDGQVKNNTISGSIQQGEKRGTLDLVRPAKIESKLFDEYAGLYEVKPNQVIQLSRPPNAPVLLYVNFVSGRHGGLLPLSENTFSAGPAYQIPAPIESTITFTRNTQGEVTGLVWQQDGTRAKRARKIKFRREEVSFQNGDVTISGTLVLPNTKAPHPAVVRIHGAGPGSRFNFADEFYPYHGIAVLNYDKRGVGKSTGNWREAGVEDLAGDTLAGIQLLRSRSDINPKQIGVAGGSEGGWAASLVAGRDANLAFLVLVAGPALSFVDEVLNEAADNMRVDGLSDKETEAALEFLRFKMSLIRSGEVLTDAGWEKMQAAAAKVKNEKWFAYVRPWAKGSWWWKKWYLMSQYDPQPFLEKTIIPVLAVYGGADRNAPAPRNVEALEKAMKKAGNKNYTIKVLPKANHFGLEAERGFLFDDELPRLRRFVPGYFDTVKWILKRVTVRR
jgi:pimeloyl-ACP methyl ester carboxylesterase